MERLLRVLLMAMACAASTIVAYEILITLIPALSGILAWLKVLFVCGMLLYLISAMIWVVFVMAWEQHTPSEYYSPRRAYEEIVSQRGLSFIGTVFLIVSALIGVGIIADWYRGFGHVSRLSWFMMLCLGFTRIIYHGWLNGLVRSYRAHMKARGYDDSSYSFGVTPSRGIIGWEEPNRSPFGRDYYYDRRYRPRSPFAQ